MFKKIPRIDDNESLIKGMEDVDFIVELAKLTLRTDEGVVRMKKYDAPSVFTVLTIVLRCRPEEKLQGIRDNLEVWK